ncbi:hypothetical protein [Paracoccus sp. (in: a-proteobacteria)]|nr:hypothetical protein [Paracoccus sp. (in: a-proteobacteria)]MDO5370864.1 hypothetical protein [Paracoccus sp. (in: a-proteobacteria)]
MVRIANLSELFHTAQFGWDYLYLGAAWDQKIRRMVNDTHYASRSARVL